ncbi:unnamed protein product [Amoebophrya sp. A120]|nr:unnamed protein product [Amoebophrya sp. A120]|eukprot:GSA120T00023878001.1
MLQDTLFTGAAAASASQLDHDNPFCVFDYPGHTIRRPPFAENYVVSTDLPQWLRKHLDSMTHADSRGNKSDIIGEQHSTEAEASINDHPLLVFKQPLKKVHVTLEDASDDAHHHYRKTLWEAYFDQTETVSGGSMQVAQNKFLDLPPGGFQAILPGGQVQGAHPEGTTSTVVPAHAPVIDHERRNTLKLHVTGEGVFAHELADSGLGIGPKLSDDVDEELFFDVLKSPRVKCPDMVDEHPLAMRIF